MSAIKDAFTRPTIVVAMLASVLSLSAGCRSADTPRVMASRDDSIMARTIVLKAVSVPRAIEVTGTVAPEFQADIATRTAGRVNQVLVKEGDYVRRGQMVIALDSRDLDAAIAEARANLAASQTQLGSAVAALSMEEASSPARVREAIARVGVASAALRSAEAQRDLVTAGPRRQERLRAAQSVAQATSARNLASATFDRMKGLYAREAISRQDFDRAKSANDMAESEYQSALLSQDQTDEGSRIEDKRIAAGAVTEAQAALRQAQAGLAQARASTFAVSQRRADVARAKAGLAQARASLAIATANRSYTTIAAPFDGVITSRMADPGAMAGPGIPLLKVQGGSLRLEVNVPESSLRAVQIGSAVPVVLDALTEESVEGKVIDLGRQGDAASHTFVAKIKLPPGSRARSGMCGRARLPLGADRSLLVPRGAIISRDGLSYVYVVGQDDIARLRFITTGDEVNGSIAIQSGLQIGDRVIAAEAAKVHDGDRIAERKS